MSADQAKRDQINQVYINTGNLLASDTLKRKVTLLPSEEILEGVNLCLKSNEKEEHVEGNTLLLRNKHLKCQLNPSQRQNYKVVVKVFLYTETCSALNDVIDFIMKQLNIVQIDSLILSLPSSGVKITLDEMKPIWECVERIVSDAKVLHVGVTDLDTNQLKDLYFWAKSVKPSTNQINLDACCIIPPEMTAFANENNVKLLTHNDPRDIVPFDKFIQILTNCGIENSEMWRRHCIVRYAVMVKGKGIVQNKGYILMANRK